MNASLMERLDTAAEAVRARCRAIPEVAIVLGWGRGDVIATMTDRIELPYRQLPHWPATTVAGHRSELVIGRFAARVVAMLAGRVHLYEGFPFDDVVFATRVMGRLGVRKAILT